MEAYSVLMSVYSKENPEYVGSAIQSVLEQTVRTDDFVIVCDGPLTQELDGILEGYAQRYPDIFHIVRLEKNMGIGAAANIGLQKCKNDLVAKMDADDIAVPQRCEKQLREFAADPALTVLGGYIGEFDEDPDAPFAVRSVPLENDAIRKFARRRQPFNNVTVMYRRSAVQAVGGYRALRRCEDYDMYVRLLSRNYYAQNLPDILVQVRVDKSANMRRASWEALAGCIQSRWNACRIGYSSVLDFLVCVAGELVIAVCPAKLQQMLYKRFLRQSPESVNKEGSLV